MISIVHSSVATDVMSEEPRTCPRCHKLVYWFRNYNGLTRCIACILAQERKDTHRDLTDDNTVEPIR